MEPTSLTSKKRTPWGLFIGLFLILLILATGAYYAFRERTAYNSPATAIVR